MDRDGLRRHRQAARLRRGVGHALIVASLLAGAGPVVAQGWPTGGPTGWNDEARALLAALDRGEAGLEDLRALLADARAAAAEDPAALEAAGHLAARLLAETPGAGPDEVLARRLEDLRAARADMIALGWDEPAARHGLQLAFLLVQLRGELDAAQRIVEEDLARLETASPWRVASRIDAAGFERFAGAWPRAEELLAQARADLATLGANPFLSACLHLAEGQLHLDRGLPDQAAAAAAADAAAAAMASLESGPEADRAPWLRLRHALLRADLGLALERYDLVVAELERELSDPGLGPLLAQRADLRPMGGWLRLRLGVALHHGDPARRDEAPPLLSALADDPTLAATDRLAAELCLARAALAQADRERAAEHLRRARALVDAVGARRVRVPAADRGILLASEARLALGAAADDGRRLELARALEGVLGELREVWTAGRRSGGQGLLGPGSSRVRAILGALVDLLVALPQERGGGARAALRVLFDVQRASSLALDLAPGAGFERTLDVLAGAGGVLVLLPAEDGSHALLLEGEEVVHVALPPDRDWLTRASELAGWVGTRPEDAPGGRRAERIATLGEELAALLLPAPIAARLAGWRSLTVVGTELLGGLPLEALPWQGSELGRELAVTRLPALPLAPVLAARAARWREPAANELLLLAAPRFDPGDPDLRELAPLPLGRGEQRELTRAFARTRVLAGAEATLERLVQELEGTRLLSVLTHGLRDPQGEAPAGLLLTAAGGHDGRLFAADAGGLRAPGVVLLGACGAGRAPSRPGDPGTNDLGGAFLRAGAAAVVLAETQVSFRGTVALLAALQDELARGHGVAEALRLARVALAGGPFDDPYHRSLLHVSGWGPGVPFPAGPGGAALRTDPRGGPGAAPAQRRGTLARGLATGLGLALVLGAALAWRQRHCQSGVGG